MRVLDTVTGEFVWFRVPEIRTYAIVSHVWHPDGEQSFQELAEIQRDVKTKSQSQSRAGTAKDIAHAVWTRTFRRLWPQCMRTDHQPPAAPLTIPCDILSDPRVSDKVRNACAVAVSHGYRYLWLDSCCIDKTSSAELSEAINSMYGWYASAEICFVYLADVEHDQEPRSAGSQFRDSKWHTRGWTLQEMIAPAQVLFLSRDWRVFGSKASLEDLIEDITGVERGVLNHTKALNTVSVARRMWWAHQRATTRVEDEAYSLMGIFGIHMSPIYGEGGNAFIRLQQEILRTTPDQSIFVWGPSLEDAWDGRPGYGATLTSPSFFPILVFARLFPEVVLVISPLAKYFRTGTCRSYLRIFSTSTFRVYDHLLRGPGSVASAG